VRVGQRGRQLSSGAKLERAYALGADLGVNYRTYPEWETQVRELTDGQGVDLVIENAATLRQSVQATRYGGTVAVIGMLAVLVPGRSRPNGDLTDLLRFGVTVTPITDAKPAHVNADGQCFCASSR
jgi:NADPH:quinone reductase-like Zn-dependent oxidoreductase